jgi:uncharacterized membrane protein
MLPSTKIFIGIFMIISGSLLLAASPFWLAEMQAEGASQGASDDDIQHFSARFMVMQFGMTTFIAIGFIVFLYGTYRSARMVERIYFNTKPATPTPEVGKHP